MGPRLKFQGPFTDKCNSRTLNQPKGTNTMATMIGNPEETTNNQNTMETK